MKHPFLSTRPLMATAMLAALAVMGGCTNVPADEATTQLAPATTAEQAPADTSFTIAVIPDTQNYLDFTHQTAEGFPFDASELFLEQMAYIAENLESEGGEIAFVTSLGDVWQHQTLEMDAEHAARGFRKVANPDPRRAFCADRESENGRDAQGARRLLAHRRQDAVFGRPREPRL